ncbi:phosphotransferase [Planococcus sp. N028]|uniref:Phosphotransferase n=1 Tax=Planococcus shixiaomingii TaxID=3058393 RepID=A0ABT8MYA3_9BACL|nr:phosphotransferase [Planococcus sp. N028]MDN7240609.1 phosphotransferase [Planococcus sp. N028]
MDAKTIVGKFGFQVKEEPVSIYPFSPVYRIKRPDGEFIVKKTQNPIHKANRLMKYTKSLKEQGVEIVIPANISPTNPMTIDEVTYVVYPFIKGDFYTGEDREIKEAGYLLGKIHSLSDAENKYGLEPYEVYDFNNEEVKESYKNIVSNAATHNVDMNPQLEVRLLRAVSQQEELKLVGLPSVATPYDFKANNLVYVPHPYLIDPDNASWVPRVFDLALALLLFHNELASAPDEPFTPKQWELFLEGYEEEVTLTKEEKTYWPKAVEHVFLDEVMWLMADVEEDWQNPSQRNLFVSLTDLLMHFEEYRLT